GPVAVMFVSEKTGPATGCPDKFTMPTVEPGSVHWAGIWNVCRRDGVWAPIPEGKEAKDVDLGAMAPSPPWLPFPKDVTVLLVKASPGPSPFAPHFKHRF